MGDRRDVSDVPASPPRRPAGRRSWHRQRDSAPVSAAQASGSEKDSEAWRGVAAVPVGGVLVFVADAQKRAFSNKTRNPAPIAIKVPRSLNNVWRQENVTAASCGARAPNDVTQRGTSEM